VTIAATRTRELNINRLILHAARTASLVNMAQAANETLLSFGRDALGLILDAAQAEGLRARAVEFSTIQLVSGQSAYPLDDDVIDVVGSAMYIDPSESAEDIAADHAGGEVPIVPITREAWNLQVAKDATGRPLQMYCHRTSSPPELRFWPTPDDNNEGTVRIQFHRLAADSNDGSKTVDVERYWGMFIVYSVARELAIANSLSPARVQYFDSVAEKWLMKCKSYSAQKAPTRLMLSHTTGWSR
jgi:hypothetical protein